MSSGIRANGKHSVTDFDCPYASPVIGMPKKKIIRETVAYMDGYYDFSNLYGDVRYENRELEYPFEVISDTPEDLHDKVSALVNWLTDITEAEISDDEIDGYHFVGTCDECGVDYEDEGFKATVKAKFTCQPFMVADDETTVQLVVGENSVTNGGRSVIVTAVSKGSSAIQISSIVESVSTMEIQLEERLPTGTTKVLVTGSPVTLKWREERI